jgi:hypothetical protein
MEDQFSIVQDWEGTRELVPRDGSQDGVMISARIKEVDFTLTDFKGGVHIIGNQEGRFGMAFFTDNDLPDHSLVVAQGNHGFMDQGVRKLSFVGKKGTGYFLEKGVPTIARGLW